MPPSLSNPSLPQTKVLRVQAPFKGVLRARYFPGETGSIHEAHVTMLRDGALQPLPAFTSINKSTARMGWLAADEEIRGVINTANDVSYLFTNSRIQRIDLPADDYLTSRDLDGTCAASAGKTLTGTSTFFTTEGLAYNTKIYVNSLWYTLDTVTDDTHLETQETMGTFSGETATVYFHLFTDTTYGDIYGPRYCEVASKLVVAGTHATYYVDDDGDFRTLTQMWRGTDIITFAGRPVLIGAAEATVEYNEHPYMGKPSLELRWPTRGDMTDWESYGAGGIVLLDDGSELCAGCTRGSEGFVFTRNSIYRLQALGQSAGNPIGVKRLALDGYSFPISNVVAGRRGMYYWSEQGLMMFDGSRLRPLWQRIGWPVQGTSGATPHLFYDPWMRCVRVYYKPQLPDSVRYIWWEDAEGFTTLESSTMYLAGTGEYYGNLYGADSLAIPVGSTSVVRRIDEATGTLNEGGDAGSPATIRWRGITFPEGAHVNKMIAAVRLVVTVGTTGTVEVGAAPDGSAMSTAGVSITASSKVQTITYDNMNEANASTAWAVEIVLPIRTVLHEMIIEYRVCGDQMMEEL